MQLLIILAVVAYLGTHCYWKSKDPHYISNSFPKQATQAALALTVAILAISNGDNWFGAFFFFVFLFDLLLASQIKPVEKTKPGEDVPPKKENQ